MYAITGITGKVGGTVARSLLAAGLPVRAVLRDASKAAPWKAAGCEIAIADMDDELALTQAFAGAQAVFVLLPPTFDPSPDFAESRAVITALDKALRVARPQRVVCLSTVGAQATERNLLTQLSNMERRLGELPMPVTFLRAGWFMENSVWDIPGARSDGRIDSMLQPTSRRIPMVATRDVGTTTASLLQESWQGKRVVELEGPHTVSPDDIAATLGRLIGREVTARAVPRDSWEARLHAQSMLNPTPRMRMVDGFNEGWICFEGSTVKGQIGLETVLKELLQLPI